MPTASDTLIPAPRWRRALRDWGPTIGLVLGISTCRGAVVTQFYVPTPSMEPTVHVGEVMLVNRAIAPAFLTWKLTPRAAAQRGDIVVFISPTQADQPEDPTPTLVKRLVALAGDTVAMRGGALYVNGHIEQVGRPHLPHVTADGPSPLLFWMGPHEISTPDLGDAPRVLTRDNWGPLVVPANTGFVLGDNREHSKDSRFLGPVPFARFIGTATHVSLSFDGDAPSIGQWLTGFRWHRLGHLLP